MAVNKRKVPLRKCAATGDMFPKKEMIRIVRTKEGEISVDLTGKKSGRGTYVSKSEAAVEKAKMTHAIESQLGSAVPEQVYDDLLHAIRREAIK
ncbi:RNase P modulator RnpM [Sporosarcina aquimarina]|uniref:YlxR family protein n=1 Tax=Sporosarcina aquimarina TaxID=114975 RepID=A0ABU4FWV8_9BACL|nr:YlxR family protein [Sporosarcina aquimarina]MDW0109190.1 YlxR family protein [Sporosarcina aquimarina]